MNSYQPSDPPLSGLCAVNRDAKVTMGSSTFNTVVVVSFDFAKSNRLSIQFSISNGEVVPFELIDTADIWFSGSDCPFRAEFQAGK